MRRPIDAQLRDRRKTDKIYVDGRVSRSPSLWRPVRATNTVVTRFQSGHGWTLSGQAVASSALDDTADYKLGSQAASFAVNSTSVTNFDSPVYGSAVDLTNKSIRVLIKVDGWANLNSLRLYAGDSTFANYRNINMNALEAKANASYIQEGKWTWVTLRPQQGSVTGTGATAVTKWRVAASAKAGTTMTVHLGAIEHQTVPTLFPNGVVSVCFDDGRLTPYQNAKPKLDALGWSATAFPIRDKMGGNGTANYMSIDQLRQCRDYSGWEIGIHADTGAAHDLGFDSMTPAQVEAELLASRQWVYDNGLGRGEGFAWPQGLFTKEVEDAAAKLCAYGRLNTTWSLETWPPENMMRIRSAANTTSEAIMKGMVDQTKQAAGWLCFTFHEVTPTGAEQLSVSTTIFNNVMDYIAAQGLAVMPMIEVLRRGSSS